MSNNDVGDKASSGSFFSIIAKNKKKCVAITAALFVILMLGSILRAPSAGYVGAIGVDIESIPKGSLLGNSAIAQIKYFNSSVMPLAFWQFEQRHPKLSMGIQQPQATIDSNGMLQFQASGSSHDESMYAELFNGVLKVTEQKLTGQNDFDVATLNLSIKQQQQSIITNQQQLKNVHAQQIQADAFLQKVQSLLLAPHGTSEIWSALSLVQSQLYSRAQAAVNSEKASILSTQRAIQYAQMAIDTAKLKLQQLLPSIQLFGLKVDKVPKSKVGDPVYWVLILMLSLIGSLLLVCVWDYCSQYRKRAK